MIVNTFLAQLDRVRTTRRGWLSRCPSHPDLHPSLSIAEGDGGKILLRCWAGCTVQEIVAVMGLQLSDLFADAPVNPCQRPTFLPKPPRFDWRRASSDFLHRAEALEVRAERVFESARGLDCAAWTGEDIDAALSAVAGAFADLQRAELFRNMAFNVRVRGLASERQGEKHAP